MKKVSGIDLFNEIYRKCQSVKNRLWIASPYIGSNNFVSHIVDKNWCLSPKIKFNLLVDYSDKGNCDPKTLRYILNNGAKIKSLKALHAKIYIFDDEVVLTSANLSETAFRRRYEIGVSLDKNESKEFIKYFSYIWNLSEIINTKDLMNEKTFRKRFGKSKDDKSNNFPLLFDITIPKIVKQKRWLKFSGFSDSKRRAEMINLDEERNSAFVNTKRGSSGGGKPSFKKDDIIILTRMGMNKGNKDIYIYGRAKIDIPHREEKDNLINYLKFIQKKEKSIVSERINRWPFGVWLKDLELIKDKKSGFIWLSELKDKSKKRLFESGSISNKSHINIIDEKYEIVNETLENRFNKYGKIMTKKPANNWVNKYIPNKKNYCVR